MKVVSAGEYCRSTAKDASSAAYDAYSSTKEALRILVNAKTCPSKVGNDDRWGNVKATNCPSNCTPKTISYKQIAGKYEACTKDEANRIADNNLQSDGISYANGLAQADRCDCVEPTKNWSANAYADGDPCNGAPSGTSALRVEVEITYSNECTTQKSLTVTASSSGTTIGSTTVTIPTGSGTKKATISFDRGYPCNSINISGRAGGQC